MVDPSREHHTRVHRDARRDAFEVEPKKNPARLELGFGNVSILSASISS
jgi:hypothetical protein